MYRGKTIRPEFKSHHRQTKLERYTGHERCDCTFFFPANSKFYFFLYINVPCSQKHASIVIKNIFWVEKMHALYIGNSFKEYC